MNLKVIFLAALVLFASIVTTAAMSFCISTPDEVLEKHDPKSGILNGIGVTPCEPIDCEGPP